MPGKKHLRGVSAKEQRQDEDINKKSAKESGRYGKRAEEVAAWAFLKQHKQNGHGKGTDSGRPALGSSCD